MPTTFAEDENNDFYIGNDGNLVITTKLEALLSTCKAALEVQKGECQYDIDRGLPNFQEVWKSSPNIPQFEAAAREILLAMDGVREINNFSALIEKDVLKYTIEIVTDYGTGEINGRL